MENVHRMRNRPWVSEVVNVKEFLNKWTKHWQDVKDLYKGDKDERTWKNEFMEKMDIGRDVLESLENECSPDSLTCKGERDIDFPKTTFEIPDGVHLQTLKLQQQDLVKRTAAKTYRIATHKNFRYREHIVNMVAKNLDKGTVVRKIKMPEVVFLVQIYRPQQRPLYHLKARRKKVYLHVEDELAVLGNQKLIHLADRISCVSDVSIPGDFSENPNMHEAMNAREVYNSGFFYINGTFYNNMSKPENRDYSKVIIDWAREKSHKIGPFKTAFMENTRFVDLELQLGYPYVYQHQGNCEHLVVFSDLRLIHPDDEQNVNFYPVLEAAFPRPRVICMVCNSETARWMTYDNNRLPENPYFFCEACFLSFNYTTDGEKIGSFSAHPFVDRTAML